MKKHIYQIDLIRAVCCIGIIVYHFACHTNSNLAVLTNTVNSNVGSIIVTVFFIVSGFVLYHSHKEIDSLKDYYLKRFKSLFPSFYLCWFIFYVINVIKVRTPFYAGNPLKLLLTLIGQDGYFSQRIVTYYTVGEWFLGAIIIVYCLYPFLLKLFKKNDKLFLIVLLALTLCVNYFNVPVISPGFPGIIESCFKFYIGMMFCKYVEILDNKKILITSIILFVIYSLVKISVLNVLLDIVYAVCLFIILFNLGNIINNKYINEISGLSYQIFLLQHMVIVYMLEYINPPFSDLSIVIMVVCILLTILFAYIVKKIVNLIMNKISRSTNN